MMARLEGLSDFDKQLAACMQSLKTITARTGPILVLSHPDPALQAERLEYLREAVVSLAGAVNALVHNNRGR
jgi:hypothetical protein